MQRIWSEAVPGRHASLDFKFQISDGRSMRLRLR
jgi:hypothetical protein